MTLSVRFCFLAASLSTSVIALGAPVDPVTLRVGQPMPRFSLLTPSSRLYVRYKVLGEERSTLDIWHREVRFENHEGSLELHIVWRWDSVGDQKFSRTEDFWFEPQTFRPLTVERRLTQASKSRLEGYRYLPDQIVGITALDGNSAKDFRQPASMQSYNFETDMELIQTLPLKAGYEARIPFYEAGPGQDEPRLYTYRVMGEGLISAPDGHVIDCWIVGTESTDPDWGPTRMWVAKKSQVMIREQTTLKDGTIFVKSLLTSDVPA